MKKYIKFLLFIMPLTKAIAGITPEDIAVSALNNEPLLIATIILGNEIYTTCILIPPATPAQNAACATKYATFIIDIQTLHIDMFGLNTPMLPGIPDPYFASPYDVCRFDIGNLILTPICGE